MESKTFLILGSSTVYGAWDIEGGWVQRLRKFLDKLNLEDKGYYLIYNSGISGDTTEQLLERFEIECKSRFRETSEYGGEKISMISIGANDSTFIKNKDGLKVSPEKCDVLLALKGCSLRSQLFAYGKKRGVIIMNDVFPDSQYILMPS